MDYHAVLCISSCWFVFNTIKSSLSIIHFHTFLYVSRDIRKQQAIMTANPSWTSTRALVLVVAGALKPSKSALNSVISTFKPTLPRTTAQLLSAPSCYRWSVNGSSKSISCSSSIFGPPLQIRHLQHTIQGAANNNNGEATNNKIPKPAKIPITCARCQTTEAREWPNLFLHGPLS